MILKYKKILSAIIVSYYPNTTVLEDLIKSLNKQVDNIILVDNGGGKEIIHNLVKLKINIEYIVFDKNKGLGYALNEGFKRAVELKSDYVATFDQDSSPTPGLILNLVNAHNNLIEKGINCAAVAPVFFDSRDSSKIYFPFYKEINNSIISFYPNSTNENYVEVDTLITSGMLIRSDVWSQGIYYDPTYFVDYTDPDWCFRARSNGFKLFGCLRVEMGHAPSDSPPSKIFGLSFFHYSPLRRYYFFRNTIKFCSASYVSKKWKKRLIIGLVIRFFVNIIIDKDKYRSIKMMIKGLIDGFRKVSGQYI
jgi:rhamnosyltransferase